MRPAILAFVILALMGCATTAPTTGETDCYDLKLRAKPIAQIPTPFPNDLEYIVISWPWFVDLEVTRVIDGEVREREISALAVLHSAYVDKTRTWLLRKHKLGGYNILRLAEPSQAKRCAQGEARPEPYLRPSENETLANLRRTVEADWRADQEAEEEWVREHGSDED
jgi:hypothetical protein